MVPAMVWVVDEAKVRVSAALTDLVRLLKVVEPAIVWEVPSKVTVPELWVKVALFVQSFPMVMVVVAVKVPDVRVKLLFMSRAETGATALEFTPCARIATSAAVKALLYILTSSIIPFHSLASPSRIPM